MTHNIGSKAPISTFLSRYPNSKLNQTMASFTDSFPSYRSIKGDGNCFYRAFAFLLLKNTKSKNFQNLFPSVEFNCQKSPLKIKTTAEFMNLVKKQVKQEIDQILRLKNPTQRQELIEKIFNKEKSFFDPIIIAYLRSLNYWNISKNEKKYQAYTTGGREMKKELERIVKFGSQSEGIEISSLSDIFKVGMTVICVNQSHLQPVYYEKYQNEGFYFFLRPGHYDLIYPAQSQKPPVRRRNSNNIHPFIQMLVLLVVLAVCIYVSLHLQFKRK